MADQDQNGTKGGIKQIAEAAEEAVTYPVLTEAIGYPSGRPADGGRPSGGAAGGMVEAAIRDVLSWRIRGADPKGFVAALKQSFTLSEVEGHTVWQWNQRSYSAQPDMGAITGAQASVYARAKDALDQSLPLLDGLYPLLPDFDPQDTDAIRAIVRSELIELVSEIGVEGGPRLQRVNGLFDLLLGGPRATNSFSGAASSLAQVAGQLGTLRDRFGMDPALVNTIDEEQNLTNFLILVDYVQGLHQSWTTFFDKNEVFLGTQLVLLSRAMAVVAESVQETYFAMDSVFMGPAERQTTKLFILNGRRFSVADLLDWVDRFSSVEGPQLITDAGKDGVETFVATARQLHGLVGQAVKLAQQPGPNPIPAFHTARVRRTLEELNRFVGEMVNLAADVKRFPDPIVTSIVPDVVNVGEKRRITVDGRNFRDGAAVSLFTGKKLKKRPVLKGTNVTVVSPTELNVTFDFGAVACGQMYLFVVNPDGGTNVIHLDDIYQPVMGVQGCPVIDSIDISSVDRCSSTESGDIHLKGTGFDSGATVFLTLAPHFQFDATVVGATSPTDLTFCIDFEDEGTMPDGDWSVFVKNPNGVISNPAVLAITSDSCEDALLSVTDVAPASVARSGPNKKRRITVFGSGFAEGAGVHLERPGAPRLLGTAVKVEAPGRLSAAFNIGDKEAVPAGPWAVVVSQPDGSARAPASLEIKEA